MMLKTAEAHNAQFTGASQVVEPHIDVQKNRTVEYLAKDRFSTLQIYALKVLLEDVTDPGAEIASDSEIASLLPKYESLKKQFVAEWERLGSPAFRFRQIGG